MLRRLNAAFGSGGGEQTLASFDATGGVVLVPVTGWIDWAAWSRVVRDAAAEAGTTIRTAGVATTAAGVGAAAREAAEVLDVVRWLGRPTGRTARRRPVRVPAHPPRTGPRASPGSSARSRRTAFNAESR